MRVRQIQRLATESDEQRERRLSRLQHNRQERNSEASDVHLPMLEQQRVQNRMKKFHEAISAIETPLCTTCLEKFPGMRMSTRSSECERCARDKRHPKLYSAANDMNPGSIPSELQVEQTTARL